MADFKPRKGSYIKERAGKFYYRRAIPTQFRHIYGGKCEWNILLEGRSHSNRLSEAHAHQHNREMEFGIGIRILARFEESQTPDGPDLSIRLNLTGFPLPDGFTVRPVRVHRDGRIIETYKIAFSRYPDYLRAAEKDGFFAMAYQEGEAQLELNKLYLQAGTARNADQRENFELKVDNEKNKIDNLSVRRGDTILSLLPKWHKREQPHKRHTSNVSKSLLTCTVTYH